MTDRIPKLISLGGRWFSCYQSWLSNQQFCFSKLQEIHAWAVTLPKTLHVFSNTNKLLLLWTGKLVLFRQGRTYVFACMHFKQMEAQHGLSVWKCYLNFTGGKTLFWNQVREREAKSNVSYSDFHCGSLFYTDVPIFPIFSVVFFFTCVHVYQKCDISIYFFFDVGKWWRVIPLHYH